MTGKGRQPHLTTGSYLEIWVPPASGRVRPRAAIRGVTWELPHCRCRRSVL